MKSRKERHNHEAVAEESVWENPCSMRAGECNGILIVEIEVFPFGVFVQDFRRIAENQERERAEGRKILRLETIDARMKQT